MDNLLFMHDLPDACCDLIYIDPPFRVRPKLAPQGREENPSAPVGEPRRLDTFLSFMQPRLAEVKRLLSPRGTVYVHLDWRTVHYVKVMLDEIFGADHFLNEIIWHYRSGGRPSNSFTRKHDSLLVYVQTPGGQTFNRLRGGEYRTKDLRLDEKGIPYKSTKRGRIHFHPDGPAISDVWEIPFLSTVAKERRGYTYQKPEALLERIIQASSNEGDLVADFFCGSGTTLAVAKRLGRRWIGCDLSDKAVAITRQRLAEVDGGARGSDTSVARDGELRVAHDGECDAL